MSERKPSTPPYVSYATFKNKIRGLASGGQLPSQIDHSVLTSMSGAARSQFLIALRFMSLIDEDDKPSRLLDDLAQSTEQGWKTEIEKLIQRHYPSQVKLLKSGTPKQLVDSFGDIGTIATPASRFFISAAKDAGIAMSLHFQKGIRGASTPKRRRQATGTGGESDVVRENPGSGKLDSITSVLLAKFPTFDPNWGEAQQKSWFDAYEKLLGMAGGTKDNSNQKEGTK